MTDQEFLSTVLVIGSSGFIGSHLTQLLTSRGHRVIGLDAQKSSENYGVDEFIQGDIRQPEHVNQALRGVDAVINLAALHADFGHVPEEYFETNDRGMSILLEAMTTAHVNRLLFTSSIAVYGDRSDEVREETTPNPTSPYGSSKLAAEQRVNEWVEADPQRSVRIIRPCVVYGERNVANMMNLIRQIDSGFFVLFGSGSNVKATAYVGNLVQAICMQYEQSSPGLKLYNYADKPDMTVNKIVGVIRRELGRPPSPLRFPLWLGRIAAAPFDLIMRTTGKNLPISSARVKKLARPTLVSAQKIRADGFEQMIEPEVGLSRMVRYFLAQSEADAQTVTAQPPVERREPANP